MLYKLALVFALNFIFILNALAEIFESEKHSFQVETLISSLNHPWGMNFLPDGRLLITERSGQLLIADLDQQAINPIKGLPEINERGQGGLLDVLVHPSFETNNWLYLSYVRGEKTPFWYRSS